MCGLQARENDKEKGSVTQYQPLRHCRAGAVLVWIPHPIEGVRRIKIYDAILCTELHFKIYSASNSTRGGVSLAGSSYLSQNQAVSRVECRTEKTRRAAQPSGGTAFRLQEVTHQILPVHRPE